MVAFTFFEGSHVVWCAPSHLFKISSFLIYVRVCVCVCVCVLELENVVMSSEVPLSLSFSHWVGYYLFISAPTFLRLPQR